VVSLSIFLTHTTSFDKSNCWQLVSGFTLNYLFLVHNRSLVISIFSWSERWFL